MNYWTNKEQILIEKYYWSYTASTSAQTRSTVFQQLMPAFTHLIRQALYSKGQKIDEDKIQNNLLYLHHKTLPRLNETRIKAALNFLWVSVCNKVINEYVTEKSRRNIKFQHMEILYDREDNRTDNTKFFASETYEPDNEQYIQDIRTEILETIDEKICEQKVINKTNTVFLILMKEFILQNDYDVRGFEQYIQERMNINKATYQSIMSRVGIRSKLFNEKLQEE